MKFKFKNLFILRKNIFKHLIAVVIVFTTVTTNAQDQKTLLKKWGEGPVQEYTVNGRKGNYTYGGVSSDKYDIQLLKMDDPYLWGAKLKTAYTTSTYEFHADNNAHAVSMRRALVPHPSLTYHMRYDEKNEHRLVVIGDYLYLLEDWKSKDAFTIKKIFKKGRLSKMKIMKEMFASKKKMEKANHEQALKEYFDKEFAIQKQKTPAWNKKHAKYIQALKDEALDWKKQIDDSYKERNAKLMKYVTVYNDRSYRIYVGTKIGGGRSIDPGSYKRFECSTATLYLKDSHSKTDLSSIVCVPNKNCGRVIHFK